MLPVVTGLHYLLGAASGKMDVSRSEFMAFDEKQVHKFVPRQFEYIPSSTFSGHRFCPFNKHLSFPQYMHACTHGYPLTVTGTMGQIRLAAAELLSQ